MNAIVHFLAQALADVLAWMAVVLGTVLHVLELAVGHPAVTLPALGAVAALALAVRVALRRQQRSGRK